MKVNAKLLDLDWEFSSCFGQIMASSERQGNEKLEDMREGLSKFSRSWL